MNTTMKILIIGLDGLDPDLINKWNITFYKQKAYGKHYIGFLSTLYTPIVWSCFLTGIDVTKHGYSMGELRRKRAADGLHPILKPLYKLRRKILRNRKLFIRHLMVRLHLADAYPPSIMPAYLLRKTFLEILQKDRGFKIRAIEIPGYNEKNNEQYRSEFSGLVTASINDKIGYLRKVLIDCENRVSLAIESINDGYDVVFVYLPLPDIAHHLLFKGLAEITRLRQHYGELADMLQPLVDKASDNNYRILIVSDHGFDLKKYYHSEHGFWSLNFNPPEWWKISTILDFKANIIRLSEGSITGEKKT